MGATATHKCVRDPLVHKCVEGLSDATSKAGCPLKCQGLSTATWSPQALANAALLHAAVDGDVEKMREALASGAEVEATQSLSLRPESRYKEQQQHQKIQSNRCDEDDQENSELNANSVTNPTGGDAHLSRRSLTPLMLAAKGGYPEAIKILLDAGGVPQARDPDGVQAIHYAAGAGCESCVLALLKARANGQAVDTDGRSAFDCLPSSCTYNRAESQKWMKLLNQE